MDDTGVLYRVLTSHRQLIYCLGRYGRLPTDLSVGSLPYFYLPTWLTWLTNNQKIIFFSYTRRRKVQFFSSFTIFWAGNKFLVAIWLHWERCIIFIFCNLSQFSLWKTGPTEFRKNLEKKLTQFLGRICFSVDYESEICVRLKGCSFQYSVAEFD